MVPKFSACALKKGSGMNFSVQKRALRCAFPKTLPIFTGFFFLGMSYGIYMRQAGFPFLYPTLTALFVYGGSLEFVTVAMLLSPFAPLQSFLVALAIQSRHLFYGIAMLDKYRHTGWKKFYLIFGMCDESFSINCSADIPKEVDSGWFMFFVNLLNQLYWVGSAALGGLIGGHLPFPTEGIEFVMTAMFVVIFLEQFLKETRHESSLPGLLASVLCLRIFGAEQFLIPMMLCILTVLCLTPKAAERNVETCP